MYVSVLYSLDDMMTDEVEKNSMEIIVACSRNYPGIYVKEPHSR
jgi:hypothetical protein